MEAKSRSLEAFEQKFNRMLKNKEQGSLAKSWRSRLLERPMQENEELILEMCASTTRRLPFPSAIPWPDGGPEMLVFEDGSGLTLERIAGRPTLVATNYVNIGKLEDYVDTE